MTDENTTLEAGKHDYDTEKHTRVVKTVLPPHLSGGPKGLGDPDDRTLRTGEIQFMVPAIKRKRGYEKCAKELKTFADCAEDTGLLVVWKCQNEKSIFNNCLQTLFNDPVFTEQCTEEYLKKRSHFRRTGEYEDPRRDRYLKSLMEKEKKKKA